MVRCGRSCPMVREPMSPIVAGASACVDSDPVNAGSAPLFAPTGVAVNGDGDVFFAEPGRHRVRKLSGGSIRTIAGIGVAGYSGDGVKRQTRD